MTIDQSIFKSYDVRGVYPSEINEEAAFQIARAFIKKTGAKRPVIGHDARISSPQLSRAFIGGMKAEGAEVFSIGQVPTECVYFSVGRYDFDAGVMVTASHNPKEYNGFKMLNKKNGDISIVRGESLISEVTQDGLEGYKKVDADKKNIWEDYLNHILSFIDLGKISNLKIVVDASNGVAGNTVLRTAEKLPIEVIPLNFNPDGNFPNHGPNPLEEGSVDKISEIIKSEKLDFGVIFDGDADRIFLVDELGGLVRADATLLLLAKYFLQKNPNMAVAYTVICSKAVPEFVKKWGGVPIRTKVGFVNVREGLIKNNGIIGGEPSGHYCFKDYFYLDSGMIAFLSLLQIISEDGRNLSGIIKELTPYPKSRELNFKVADKELILKKVKQKYSNGKQDYLDGVTVGYNSWWFNIRSSNTEPLLRLTIEADSQELLSQKQKELTSLILNGKREKII